MICLSFFCVFLSFNHSYGPGQTYPSDLFQPVPHPDLFLHARRHHTRHHHLVPGRLVQACSQPHAQASTRVSRLRGRESRLGSRDRGDAHGRDGDDVVLQSLTDQTLRHIHLDRHDGDVGEVLRERAPGEDDNEQVGEEAAAHRILSLQWSVPLLSIVEPALAQ